MRDFLPWLMQGDIFRNVPVPEPTLIDGKIAFDTLEGPAVLVTHGCAIDKRNNAGMSTVERFQFARLRTVAALALDRQDSMRANAKKRQPLETLFVAVVADLGEAYILLSESYYLPAAYFEPSFADYTGDERADPADSRLLTPSPKNDTRIGRLDADQALLLGQKMQSFWTRTETED